MRNFYEVKFDAYAAGDLTCDDGGIATVQWEAKAYRVQHLCELDHTAYAGAMEYISRRSYGVVERYDRDNPRAWFDVDWRVYEPSYYSNSYCPVSYYRNPPGVKLHYPCASCDRYFVAADLMSGILSKSCDGEITDELWEDFYVFLRMVGDFCHKVYDRKPMFWGYLDPQLSIKPAIRSVCNATKQLVCDSAATDVGLRGFGRYL